MITDNDLYDLSAVFITIRNDIQNKFNDTILEQVLLALEPDEQIMDNGIRKAVSSVENIDQFRWRFVYCDNVYVHRRILKNRYIYQMLSAICIRLRYLMKRKEFEHAYDLVDSVHCLPEIIVENNFCVPKTYWKTYIVPYRCKWDKEFLKEYQKQLK